MTQKSKRSNKRKKGPSEMTTTNANSVAYDDKDSAAVSAMEKCQQARQVWLSATTKEEMEQVEGLYRSALNSQQQASSKRSKQVNKKQKVYAELTPKQYRAAAERLSLLYCQSGRTDKAKKGLEYLGFQCRLAKDVLDYPAPRSSSGGSKKASNHVGAKTKNSKQKKNPSCSYCGVYNNFLSPTELEHLQSIFMDPQASYWTDHQYQVEPPSPYFSYVIPLKTAKHSKQHGFLGGLIQKIVTCPQLRHKFPALQTAKFVEMWAHNRPHASGHQLHFDSDDEGRGGIVKNPIISTILYLTGGDEQGRGTAVGGPSLVTNQKLKSTHLATKGWLAYPKLGRLVAFDGSVLHGVIPGKGVVPTSGGKATNDDGDHAGRRRVTLMLAFWKDIEIRDGQSSPGSARPFPLSKQSGNAKQPKWARELTRTAMQAKPREMGEKKSFEEEMPISLKTVYETLDGEPWTVADGMPDYETVFQGF